MIKYSADKNLFYNEFWCLFNVVATTHRSVKRKIN